MISSGVNSYSGNHGNTYSVNIFYSYQFNDREFKANTYGFMAGSSSGYRGKQAIVSLHPPGSKSICYVNPAEPTEAVLERGFTTGMWFGLIPLLFVLFGALGLTHALKPNRRDAMGNGAISGRWTQPAGRFSGDYPSSKIGGADAIVLKPKTSPLAKWFGAVAICLFWNGIVSVFMSQAVSAWRAGRPEWFLMIFLIPFVVIGLGLIGAVFYFLLALFNPRPHLIITPGAVPLGGTLHVRWNFTGRATAISNLRLRLEGREEATFTRGTRTETDRSTFVDLEIASVNTHREIQAGEGAVQVPANLVPSFTGQKNKIIWALLVHGDIARWPDVEEEFIVTVLPAARKKP